MRSAVSLLLLAAAGHAAAIGPFFSVLSDDPGAWAAILSSVGLQTRPPAEARIVVAPAGTVSTPEWKERVRAGAILILEGESPLAEAFGFRPGPERVKVASIVDDHNASLRIVWEQALVLPRFELPPAARVFARDRWTGAPLTAGFTHGSGAVLWVAAPPGERGYERFPYLLQALCDLGFEPPFRSSRLWAFFDSSYRSRVDLDYFAARWRKSGIAALHVAAWHYWESDPERDAYLRKLIEACHREGILVYAWLELPHVSERFWNDHPEWREQTALLQDAHLDWRKLMNLVNRDCFRAVAVGVRRVVQGFDWDGVNLAELYFESLEGIANPSRFTPMNADVRAEFRRLHHFDPLDLFRSLRPNSPAQFLEYRAGVARRIQEEWLAEMDAIRQSKPYLDLVLTHVDDRFDTGMRDAIGADAARVLPLLDRHRFTFLIEDPATVWHLGPQRYRAIADRYQPLTRHRDKLAIDLNIVERYQNVYPTRQQTGTELFQLLQQAAANFDRVALYFENSLLAPDLPLLPSAASAVTRFEKAGDKRIVASRSGVGLPWKGGAIVDGAPWPVLDSETIWLPAGVHTVEEAPAQTGPRVLRLNAELRSARFVDPSTIEFRYESAGRGIAILDGAPGSVQIDGVARTVTCTPVLMLPQGEHRVSVRGKSRESEP
jgi:hypothetical protein